MTHTNGTLLECSTFNGLIHIETRGDIGGENKMLESLASFADNIEKI